MGKKGEVVVWSLPPFFPFLRAATVELLLWWRLRWSGGEKRWRGDRNKVAARCLALSRRRRGDERPMAAFVVPRNGFHLVGRGGGKDISRGKKGRKVEEENSFAEKSKRECTMGKRKRLPKESRNKMQGWLHYTTSGRPYFLPLSSAKPPHGGKKTASGIKSKTPLFSLSWLAAPQSLLKSFRGVTLWEKRRGGRTRQPAASLPLPGCRLWSADPWPPSCLSHPLVPSRRLLFPPPSIPRLSAVSAGRSADSQIAEEEEEEEEQVSKRGEAR